VEGRITTVDAAETLVRQWVLVGAVTHGRAGVDSSTTTQYNKMKMKDRRVLVQDKVRASLEEQ